MKRVLDETLSGDQWAADCCPVPDDERISAAPLLACYSDHVPVVESTYASYNIVRIGETYVAAALELGPRDSDAVLRRAASRPPENDFMVGRSVSELQREIDRIRNERCAPTIVGAYRGYNVVRVGYTCVAPALELGIIGIPPSLSGGKPWPPSDELIVNPDVDALKREIDRLIATRRLNRLIGRFRRKQ